MTIIKMQSGRRRWIRWVILVLVIIALLALAASEAFHLHTGTLRARDTADMAMMFGLSALSLELQQPNPSEDRILVTMTESAARGEFPGDYDLLGLYLDADGSPLSRVGAGFRDDARGLRVVVHGRVPTPLTRFLGLAGWPVERQAEFTWRPE